MVNKKDDFEKYLEEQLKNEEFRKEYEELEPIYSIIEMEIKLRRAKKITQKELARRMNTSQAAIARFESGSVNPSIAFIARLSKALGAKVEIKLKENRTKTATAQ